MEYLRYLKYCLRVILFIIANFLCIPPYLTYCVILYPVKKFYPELYWQDLESRLFRSLLGIVSSWLYIGGYKVVESGDDLTPILDKEAIVMVNHQSTGDVPFIMSSIYSKGAVCGSMMWIMDFILLFTNFGWVSFCHGDFFIQQGKSYRETELVRLKKHLLETYWSTFKKWIVVFPEGGFLYKRRARSQTFAEKNNHPVLQNVALPRIGCFKTITDALNSNTNTSTSVNGVPPKKKWVIDITIGYPEGKSLSFPGMIAGIYKPCQVHMHYRAYRMSDVPMDCEGLRSWLYDRYTEKDALLESYYKENKSMDVTDQQKRHLSRMKEGGIKMDLVLILFYQMFYILSFYVMWNILYVYMFPLLSFFVQLVY